MRIVLFVHSLLSDWNHGNAHFLRGVATELIARDHDVRVYEPVEAWSVQHLVADHGPASLSATRRAYPALESLRYHAATLDLDEALDGAELVLVHEWNSHDLVRRVGEHHLRSGGYTLLFHDTHHRSVSDPDSMSAYDLSQYDGVLAFGEIVRQRYVERGWASRAWTWHEAADVRVFTPASDRVAGLTPSPPQRDIIWIGNWGDEERSAELREFLIEPAAALRLTGTVHGVRYPAEALAELRRAGLAYAGWLPNYRVPEVFAAHGVTVHVPRRPYVDALAGIPTIRPFEALACGIPLVSAPWNDVEGLFRPGMDYLVARNGHDMQRHLRAVLNEPALAASLASHGRETILARHTCAHRVDELLAIVSELHSTRPHVDTITTSPARKALAT